MLQAPRPLQLFSHNHNSTKWVRWEGPEVLRWEAGKTVRWEHGKVETWEGGKGPGGEVDPPFESGKATKGGCCEDVNRLA